MSRASFIVASLVVGSSSASLGLLASATSRPLTGSALFALAALGFALAGLALDDRGAP